MSKRSISLYYGSISMTRAVEALVAWVTGLPIPQTRKRAALSRAVRKHFDAAEVFSMGSGRSALAVFLKAAGIGPGDEVLLSSYTCLAVPTAVVAVGATPVYVDINPDTLNFDADAAVAAQSPRVRAVVVQHTMGKPAPIEAVIAAFQNQGVLVVEDCALALGSRIGDRYVGTFGDAAVFSMELSKALSCGWGGILLVNDRQLGAAVAAVYGTLDERGFWASARDLWQTAISTWCYHPALYHAVGKYVLFLGFKGGLFRRSTPKPEFDGHISPGFMVKLPGAQAGLARLQWQDFSRITATCESHARELRRVLAELDILTPGAPNEGEVSIAPRVSFLVTNRPEACSYFSAAGIELGQWFDGPMSPVPSSALFNYTPGNYPSAEFIARRVVNLPCYSRLSATDLAHIVATLRSFVQDCPGCAVRAS